MGESLSDLFYRCGRKFSLKTVLMLGQQLVSRLEAVHEAGIVHRDVKPGNFVMGRGEEAGTVFVIDFGLSNFWSTNNGHIPFNMESPFRGTHRYASVNSHRKFEQSRRDDLEAIAYVLIYFINGGLPWQSLRVARNKRRKAIGLSKASYTPEVLCENLPHQFASFLKYVKALRFEQTPDYEYCRNLFRNCFDEAGFEDDGIWDWELLSVPPRSVHPSIAHGNNGMHVNALHSQMGVHLYTHPSLSMGVPYHHHHQNMNASLNTPHLPHSHGVEMSRATMHAPTSIRATPSSSVPMRSHTIGNITSAASSRHAPASPVKHPHLTATAPIPRSNTASLHGGSAPRPCVNLASTMPLSHVGRSNSHLMSQQSQQHPRVSMSSTNSFASESAPTYASMLRSSNGSPLPADSIAYLDYCNSQTQHSSQSLSNSSYLQPTTSSTSTASIVTAHNGRGANNTNNSKSRLDSSRFSTNAPVANSSDYNMPQRVHMGSSRSLLSKNSNGLLMNGLQQANTASDLGTWNTTPTAASHHSSSSPMLGSTYESAAAASGPYANGSAFVSTHLLQLNSPSHLHHHHHHHHSYGNNNGMGHLSVTVPSSPTNSLMLNGPSSPLLHEPSPSPLMHLSSLLDEDTLFSNNSMPPFSTASSSSSGSVLFSRNLLTSSSSTVTAPIAVESSQLSNASSLLIGSASPVPTPDSPSSSTRPDSPLQLDANLWVDASASTLADAGVHVASHNMGLVEDDDGVVVCGSAPFASSVVTGSSHHMHHHHHHIISIDDALSTDVATAPASALVCVEQPVSVNMKKRSRNVLINNNVASVMCSTLPEPTITKRRSTRLLEKDYQSARAGAGY